MSLLQAGLMLLLAMAQAIPSQATGALSGLVQAADTHIPIPDARILITGPGTRETTIADGSGRFAFSSLAPGVYRITIEKETFAYDVLGAPGVLIKADATATVTFNLQRAGIIVGEVRDDRGNPRSGVPVTAIRKIDGGTSTQPGTQRMTNDLGEFRLDGLLEGEYIVLASPPSRGVRTAVALLPTYYPAATDKNAANSVTVKAGETIGAVFITMAAAPAFEVTGVAVDEEGQPLAGLEVVFVFSAVQTASPTQGTLQVQVAGFTTRADGTFRLTGLGPGSYRLTPLGTPGAPGIMTEIERGSAAIKGNASTVKVDVRDANVSGVRIVVPRSRP